MQRAVIEIKADLLCNSGLHIGNQEGHYTPRSINAPVLQNPAQQLITPSTRFAPYISGSALKGKLRNIAEILFEKPAELKFVNQPAVPSTNTPERKLRRHECSTWAEAARCEVCFLFGASTSGDYAPATKYKHFNGRLQFRNALQKNTLEKEVKTENALDRLTAAANPRTMERTAPNAVFGFNVVFFSYENESFIEPMRHFLGCLRFLEMSYLGGKGSRGSGSVTFENISIAGHKFAGLKDIDSELAFLSEGGEA